MTLPIIIGRDRINVFNFYRENAIYQGMTFDGQLFQQVEVFPENQRAQALELAIRLGRQGQVVLTQDEDTTYTVWADVRVPVQAQPVMVPPHAPTQIQARIPSNGQQPAGG